MRPRRKPTHLACRFFRVACEGNGVAFYPRARPSSNSSPRFFLHFFLVSSQLSRGARSRSLARPNYLCTTPGARRHRFRQCGAGDGVSDQVSLSSRRSSLGRISWRGAFSRRKRPPRLSTATIIPSVNQVRSALALPSVASFLIKKTKTSAHQRKKIGHSFRPPFALAVVLSLVLCLSRYWPVCFDERLAISTSLSFLCLARARASFVSSSVVSPAQSLRSRCLTAGLVPAEWEKKANYEREKTMERPLLQWVSTPKRTLRSPTSFFSSSFCAYSVHSSVPAPSIYNVRAMNETRMRKQQQATAYEQPIWV